MAYHLTASALSTGSDIPMLSPDGTTVLVPNTTNGWVQWSVGNPGASTPSNVTPHDPRWPKSSGGFLFSSDSKVIMTFPFKGNSFDLWDEENHTHIAGFSIPDSQTDYPAVVGPGGRQLVIGIVTGGGFAFSKLLVYDTPQA